MTNKLLQLFKKEILTIVRDRKSFLTFIIISLALNPLMILGIGAIQKFQEDEVNKHDVIITIDNKSDNTDLVSYLKNSKVIKVIDSNDNINDLKNKLITGYLEITGKDDLLKTTYVYDQSSNVSTASAVKVQTLVQSYSKEKRAVLLKSYNLSEEQLDPVSFVQKTLQEVENQPAQSSLVLLLLPYFLFLGLIQGSAQFAIELTAGEKERNTLATTLSLNVSRATIGIAKILAILVLSLLALTLNIISMGITFSVVSSGIFGGDSSTGLGKVNITSTIVLQMFLVLLPLSFLVASLLILLGIFARNQKEAGLYILPLILSAVFIGISSSAFDVNTPVTVFFIPLLGHVALIRQILLGYFIPLNWLISAASTIVLFLIILFVSINMFKKEEVIFRK